MIETLTTCDMCGEEHTRESGYKSPPPDWGDLEIRIFTQPDKDWTRVDTYLILCPKCIEKLNKYFDKECK